MNVSALSGDALTDAVAWQLATQEDIDVWAVGGLHYARTKRYKNGLRLWYCNAGTTPAEAIFRTYLEMRHDLRPIDR